MHEKERDERKVHMTTFLVIMFGFLCLVPTAEGQRCNANVEVGSLRSSGDTLSNGNSRQYITTGNAYMIDCCGVVDSWTFYVWNSGTVNLQVWRNTGTGTYQLVGTSQYTYASGSFLATETLTSATYIPVQSGDYIGWYSAGTEVIAYKGGGAGNKDGIYEDTNTLVSPGNTIPAPGSTFSNKEYVIKAGLGAGNSPTFANLPSTVTVPCHTATLGQLVYTVTATDTDVLDTLTLTLDSVATSSHFTLDPATGQVTLSTSSQTITTYNLDFTIDDSCSSTSSTLNVVVSNTAPYFSNLPGTTSLGCFSPVGTVVFTVIPTDDDGITDTTTMTLSAITPSAHFSFDTTTGVVTMSSTSLTIGTYTMTFSITDVCGQSSTSTLTITVTDNDPSFSNLDSTISVGCYLPFGTTVYTVTSADGDTASGDSVTMFLNSVTPASHFNFDANTGVVSVYSSSLVIGSYAVSVTATDTCGRSASNTLTINVIDSDPYFSNLDGSTFVGCYTPSGTTIFTVISSDGNIVSGDSITMTLDSIIPSSHFAFDSTTGVVTVSSSSLTIGSYIMTFSVADSCGQSVTNTLTITVTDSTPSFSNLNAIIATPTTVTLGDVLYTVTSVDGDLASGDSVTTTLDSVTPSSHFAFDASTGQVSVTNQLIVTDYILTFTVTDLCGQSSTNTLTISVYNNVPVITSLPTTVDVREDETSEQLLHTVVVSDADGHTITCSISDTVPPSAPFLIKFINTGTGLDSGIYLSPNPGLNYSTTNTYLLTINCTDGYDYDTKILYIYIVANGMSLISNLQNSTSVSTTTVVSSEVFRVLTSDLENDQLSFTLTCAGTVTCPFAIYSTGSILLSQTLLGSTTLAYELDIVVSDLYRTSSAHRLTVYVSDLNTAPVLANLPQTIQISEDTTPGSSLFLVSVYDEDLDVNFAFEVVTSPSDGGAKFVIDDATKTVSLTTTQSLDYETTSQYMLNMSVSDGTESSPFAVLTVQVADVNEAPSLLQTHYYIAYAEGTAGTSFNLPSIQASDPDAGDTLTFSIESTSNVACGVLSINSATGIMGYATDFDVDSGTLSSFFTCIIRVEDSGGLAATATATLSIADINDNQPLFTNNNNIVVSAYKTTAIGTHLTSLNVRDNDLTAVNQEVLFNLTQTDYYFALSSNGNVTLAADLNSIPAGTMFNATITVRNVGYPVSDTTIIFLKVVEEESSDFWDNGANIAWVTLLCLLLLVLAGLVSAYLLWKYRPCCKGGSQKFVKVKPTDPSTPRPREDYMHYQDRSLTPTDISLTGRWDAWGKPWNP